MNKKLFFILPLIALLFTGCGNKQGSSGSPVESQTTSETTSTSSESQSDSSTSSNSDIPLEDAYTVTIGDTTTDLLPYKNIQLEENQVGQFGATIASAQKDDAVVFLNRDNLIPNLEAERDTEVRKNLIVGSIGNLKIHNDADNFNVILKTWNDGSCTYWADGYIDDSPAPELGKYIYISSNGTDFTPDDLSFNTGSENEYIYHAELETTQQFYFYIDGSILRYAQVLTPCLPLVDSVGDDGNIAVKEAGEYNFVVSATNGVYLEKVPEPQPATVYQIQFTGQEPITLVKNDGYTPIPPENDVDYVLEEYQASATNLTKGMVLKLFADNVEVTTNVGAETYGENLIHNDSKGFMFVHNDADASTITVKMYASGGISIYGTGYVMDTCYGPEGGALCPWYIVGQGSLWDISWYIDDSIQLYSNPNNPDDIGCVLNVPFEVGDLFKLTDGTTWYGYEKVDTTVSENNAGLSCFEEYPDGFEGYNFRCKTAGYYDIYVNQTGTFWIQVHA